MGIVVSQAPALTAITIEAGSERKVVVTDEPGCRLEATLKLLTRKAKKRMTRQGG